MAKKDESAANPIDTTTPNPHTADPKKHAGDRLVLALYKDAAIGNGKRKAGTVVAYVIAADGATLEEARQLINNPALQKVTREDAK